MKPDQHKKKRSAQYKKKHGISNMSKDKAESSNKEKNSAKEQQSSGKASTTGAQAGQPQGQHKKYHPAQKETNAAAEDEVHLKKNSFRLNG